MLTERQLAAYRNDGFIVIPDVFSLAEIAELRAVTDEFVVKSTKVAANDEIYDLEDTHSANDPRVRRIKTPHAHHEIYKRASRNPAGVPNLGELLGDVRLHTGKLHIKSTRERNPHQVPQECA